MDTALINHYRAARAHQIKTFGSLTVYPSGRTEVTAGSAAYGLHAIAALNSARSQINFRHRLGQMVAEGDKRSKAAKRGWKTRRANAA